LCYLGSHISYNGSSEKDVIMLDTTAATAFEKCKRSGGTRNKPAV